ncbi:hypothetical protein CWI38_1214p0010 [Hamiltosporidium tvaerminnensis]|uniref:Uncharacterized protein n=2 Tax=Hamiltosporidium TaxID=1176354 RepID=A0A4V2JXE2_9MICR|nr:hypothetical protein CWI38_1214p0010 [Hamiltosporidium tvaerminnensis]
MHISVATKILLFFFSSYLLKSLLIKWMTNEINRYGQRKSFFQTTYNPKKYTRKVEIKNENLVVYDSFKCIAEIKHEEIPKDSYLFNLFLFHSFKEGNIYDGNIRLDISKDVLRIYSSNYTLSPTYTFLLREKPNLTDKSFLDGIKELESLIIFQETFQRKNENETEETEKDESEKQKPKMPKIPENSDLNKKSPKFEYVNQENEKLLQTLRSLIYLGLNGCFAGRVFVINNNSINLYHQGKSRALIFIPKEYLIEEFKKLKAFEQIQKYFDENIIFLFLPDQIIIRFVSVENDATEYYIALDKRKVLYKPFLIFFNKRIKDVRVEKIILKYYNSCIYTLNVEGSENSFSMIQDALNSEKTSAVKSNYLS